MNKVSFLSLSSSVKSVSFNAKNRRPRGYCFPDPTDRLETSKNINTNKSSAKKSGISKIITNIKTAIFGVDERNTKTKPYRHKGDHFPDPSKYPSFFE